MLSLAYLQKLHVFVASLSLQLAREAVQCQSVIPHIVVGNQILSHVNFSGIFTCTLMFYILSFLLYFYIVSDCHHYSAMCDLIYVVKMQLVRLLLSFEECLQVLDTLFWLLFSLFILFTCISMASKEIFKDC